MMAKISEKVKVTGSKVKVKCMILLKICLAYKSCSISWIDTKMDTNIQYDDINMHLDVVGHQIIGQGL